MSTPLPPTVKTPFWYPTSPPPEGLPTSCAVQGAGTNGPCANGLIVAALAPVPATAATLNATGAWIASLARGGLDTDQVGLRPAETEEPQ